MTAQVGQAEKGGGAQDSDTIDLSYPGKLWCKSIFYRDTTFHLVLPQKRYTKNQLTLNPQLAPADQLMRPWKVAAPQQDKDGRLYCDLDATGRATEIMGKLNQRYERGEPPVQTVRAVWISTAQDAGARDPQVAEVKDYKLVPIPQIALYGHRDKDPLRTYVTVQNYKGGLKEFKCEFYCTGPIRDIEITTTPAADMKVAGGPSGKGKVTMTVEEGKRYQIAIPVPFVSRKEQTSVHHPFQWYGYDCWYRHAWNEVQEREIWNGGDIVVRVAGTGNYKGLIKSLQLRAESWAAAWLNRTPPPPLRHNHC